MRITTLVILDTASAGMTAGSWLFAGEKTGQGRAAAVPLALATLSGWLAVKRRAACSMAACAPSSNSNVSILRPR